MAKSCVATASLVVRHWDQQSGLTESAQTFGRLDELFGLCLQTEDPDLVDRIVIDGLDADGQARMITFIFQSVLGPSE